ncbi:MAG TPA: A/G-specific adenine glycosylase [Spirochaetia bacterium]|nr:A/G-specific adenine glycosylase [Spirochaetia bacterium]
MIPYRILVSEFMLQQTGVTRVLSKYREFLEAFPSMRALAEASVQDVLAVWKGLGYNRRALALRETARIIRERHRGRIPRTVDELSALPGIGRATASAIIVFSCNIPLVFIETNIRRAYIHAFFPECRNVADSDLLPLVAKTLDRENPREWYYALMDYGASLRNVGGNPNRRSAAYARQSPFEGSLRQLRGQVLEVMLALRGADATQVEQALPKPDKRLNTALGQLVDEGFLRERKGRYFFR